MNSKPVPVSEYEAMGIMVRERATGSSFRQIASDLPISTATVRRRLLSATTNNSLFLSVNRTKTRDKVDELIELLLARDPDISSAQLSEKLASVNIHLSPSAVRRRCISLGYTYRRTRYGFCVRVPNRQPRVTFCEKILREPEMCKISVFLDECSIELFEKGPGRRCKDASLTKCSKPKHPLSMHTLGGISSRGATSLLVWNGLNRMNASFFIEKFINPILVPFVKRVFDGRCLIMMDNSPVHTARATQLAIAEADLKVESWPAESPDINPIETTWSHMKQFIRSRIKPQSEIELVSGLTLFWSQVVTPDYCQAQINRIPTVAQKVIQVHGGPTFGT